MNDSHIVIARYLSAAEQASPVDANGLWVLATLIEKIGSSYRKEGAMMFIAPSGKTIGALSGGCLEKDIVHQAHRVSVTNTPAIIEYDSLEDDYVDPMMNTGCLGKIKIALLPISDHSHKEIVTAYEYLEKAQTCLLQLNLSLKEIENDYKRLSVAPIEATHSVTPHYIEQINGQLHSFNTILPRPRLLVIGGGHDAIPFCQITVSLGWHIHIWDERIPDSRLNEYIDADIIDNNKRESTQNLTFLQHINGVILKSHNIAIDAYWLSQLEGYHQSICYIGILGPKNRKQKVIAHAQLKDPAWAEEMIDSPAGFDIGGDTSESIALSIIAKAHSAFH